tara:strand:+ start:2667 stop:3503 length:837 start_codon:yes stop_codon:yes gene_type:complete
MNNIAFFGFGKLGLKCLIALQKAGYNIQYILTHKDLSKNSVDAFAQKNNIPYYYNDLRKNKKILDIYDNKKSILISINYRYILKKSVFSQYCFAINIHGSLLPKYRGRTPHVWAIINGEKYAGVTAHLIDEGVDTGEIIKQKKIAIKDCDTGASLLKKYENIYPILLIDSINFLINGGKTKKQNDKNASFFGKREPSMGYIDFYQTKKKIINFVRAQSSPYPGAYYYLSNGKKIIINKIEESKTKNVIKKIGKIQLLDKKMFVKCNNGILEIIDFEIN